MSFEEVLNSLSSATTEPYDDVEKSETAMQVRRIVTDLPENLREILILAYFNKFSYKQIASILSIPIGTVKSRLHTAVGRFARDYRSAVSNKETR